MAKQLQKALPLPEHCPGCGRSRHTTEFAEPTGTFAYYKLFCLQCRKTLSREQIQSRGRSYVAKYKGNLRYKQVQRARKRATL